MCMVQNESEHLSPATYRQQHRQRRRWHIAGNCLVFFPYFVFAGNFLEGGGEGGGREGKRWRWGGGGERKRWQWGGRLKEKKRKMRGRRMYKKISMKKNFFFNLWLMAQVPLDSAKSQHSNKPFHIN